MALDIYTNNYSIIAQNNLTSANNLMTKSIERLSSGLRINHASDDASGLAISEKLRAQIRGLDRANMNAQDAVSFLQTAEGGMEVIGDMLQRMRELAVQAGNGTYTTNDRKELQKEVDQLKSEINRISASTEYNTKKLLTGDAAGLWSSSSSSIEAIIKGAPAEGNYRLEVTTQPGANAIYKSDIMEVVTTSSSTSPLEAHANFINVEVGGAGSVIAAQYLSGNSIDEEFTLSISASVAADSAIKTLSKDFGASNMTTASASFALATSTLAKQGYLVAEFIDDNGGKAVSSGATVNVKFTFIDATNGSATETIMAVTAGTAANVGSLGGVAGAAGEITFTLAAGTTIEEGAKLAVGVSKGVVGLGVTADSDEYTSTKLNVATASIGANSDVTIYALKDVAIGEDLETAGFKVGFGATAPADGQTNTIKAVEGAASTNISATYIKGEAGVYTATTKSADVTATITAHSAYTAGTTGKVSVAAAAAVGDIGVSATITQNSGYLVLTINNDIVSATATDVVSFTAKWIDAATGEETETTVEVSAAAAVQSATFTIGGNDFKLSTVAAGLVGQNFKSGNQFAFSVQAAVTNGMSTTVDSVDGNYKGVAVATKADESTSIYTLKKVDGGDVKTTGLTINAKDPFAAGTDYVNVTSTGTGTTTGGLAGLDTKLAQIGRFTNADGRMILDNTQELTVYGNGGQSTIFVEGCDTVQDFKDKLTKALVDLGMGATAQSAGSQEAADKINSNLVQFVTAENKTSLGNNAVEGTFIIQSALLGSDSEISFAGDESLVNAFSLATIQEAGKSQTTVAVYNAHTNEMIGEDTVCDGVLRGVIKGVDVKVDSSLGTTATWNASTNSIDFATATKPTTTFLHVVDNKTEVQIGANEGQTFDISIGRMDTTALGIDDAYLTTMSLSQKAITKFDQALEKVNSSRATIGAQINRLEYTQKNLSVSSQNLTAAESRIRDLDVASESAAFARNNILVNSAVAMLAQANQLPQVALQLIGR